MGGCRFFDRFMDHFRIIFGAICGAVWETFSMIFGDKFQVRFWDRFFIDFGRFLGPFLETFSATAICEKFAPRLDETLVFEVLRGQKTKRNRDIFRSARREGFGGRFGTILGAKRGPKWRS